jgi:peptidoglycan/xylan/chitin deacetylase (PgdA/CDA1 family)
MNNVDAVKSIAFPVLRVIQADKIFRRINRKKILILAYHGLTDRNHDVLPWTTIPVGAFEKQIRYISTKYRVFPLQKVVNEIKRGASLPDNTAVLTFDDGYRNNLTLALPILKKYNVPATIFLTAGYIGTEKILPLDEAFLIIAGAQEKAPFITPELGIGPILFDSPKAVYQGYKQTVAALKKLPTSLQKLHLARLRDFLKPEYKDSVLADFQMLTWGDVHKLLSSGLIDIGAHTISHEILTNVSHREAEQEILASKSLIEQWTGHTINLFAYPNGTPADYDDRHITCLKNTGFSCSVTTTGRLNRLDDNCFCLGRICVGPELSSSISRFALMAAGFNGTIRKALEKYAV